MVTVRTGASPQDVLQGARHVLFVEGTKDGLDVAVDLLLHHQDTMPADFTELTAVLDRVL